MSDDGHSPWLQLVAMRQQRDAALAEVEQLKAQLRYALRPRLVARPASDGQCWALMTLSPADPRLPCVRHARPGHLTCGTHRDWEAAAQAAQAADETLCP